MGQLQVSTMIKYILWNSVTKTNYWDLVILSFVPSQMHQKSSPTPELHISTHEGEGFPAIGLRIGIDPSLAADSPLTLIYWELSTAYWGSIDNMRRF